MAARASRLTSLRYLLARLRKFDAEFVDSVVPGVAVTLLAPSVRAKRAAAKVLVALVQYLMRAGVMPVS